ncbi:MAG: hypothetical protein KKG59_03985 [Nanoarchaeota archaeon]|nr:hypothetical protein [Nanoarchaeota archaeon]
MKTSVTKILRSLKSEHRKYFLLAIALSFLFILTFISPEYTGLVIHSEDLLKPDPIERPEQATPIPDSVNEQTDEISWPKEGEPLLPDEPFPSAKKYYGGGGGGGRSGPTDSIKPIKPVVNNTNNTNQSLAYIMNKKNDIIIFNYPQVLADNMNLLIPRRNDEDTLLYCENADDHEQVGLECGDIEGIHQRILSENDTEVNITEDGLFFVVNNVDPGGIMSYFDAVNKTRRIKIQSPSNGTGDDDGNISFEFRIVGLASVVNCTLNLDESYSEHLNIKPVAKQYNISIDNIPLGQHRWSVSCIDRFEREFSSGQLYFSVFYMFNFSGQTTNLSDQNIENVSNFTLEKIESGMIKFTENVNLSAGGNFNNHIYIGPNLAIVQSSHLPMLNKTAQITLYNLDFQRPIIFMDGEYCPECTASSIDGGVTFNVQHFSSYSVDENSRIDIYDDSDNESVYKLQDLDFYANFRDTATGDPIQGAGVGCNITFVDTGEFVMDYNATLKAYTYDRSFSTEGVHFFDVLCNGSALGFANLEATDYASIRKPLEPVGATVDFIRSSKGSDAPASDPEFTEAGNITDLEMVAPSITQNWQGYYGNVSGQIVLSDSSNRRMYDWNATNPTGEVYASRANDVNFPTIKCSNQSHVNVEEDYFEQVDGDSDRINSTFNESDHPAFVTGSIPIGEDSCKATNIYVNSSVQYSQFYQVLLADAAWNLVYTSILEQDKYGYNTNTTDFQMIVGENGQDFNTERTLYYFWVEL